MSLQSMTGFARTNGNHEDYSWLWELKSVNGRGLEIRNRLPLGYDAVEEAARKILKAELHRGSVNFHLQLHHQGTKADYQINKEFLNELIALSQEKAGLAGVKSPRIDGLLGLKGVIEPLDKALPDEKERSSLEAALITSFKEAVAKLKSARLEEGGQLAPVLSAQLAEIKSLTEKALSVASLRPDAVKERIAKQMELLLGNSGTADEERIEQELAILATKADISEELDRLASHITTATEVLNARTDEAVGRRLDFICQEFNRETNTFCSKSNDKELTQIGLDLKVIIDRFREQVQNIE